MLAPTIIRSLQGRRDELNVHNGTGELLKNVKL